MRFESVKAHAFGPFRDKQLRFEPGMNVIYGPNEAGKSTWHSALFAGLCGQRRGRGRQQKSDRDFQERHEPWDDSSTWDVGAVVALDRGIRVELRHNLTGSAPAMARDADIAGRDYANEIMYDGTPDGSRWLGLNRRSFLSVACVRQADILGVLDDADALQEELQRAAATAGTDETAARALNLLAAFRNEHVGSQRAPTKPLQKSTQEVTAKRNARDVARGRHDEYLTRRNRLATLEQTAAKETKMVEAACAVRAEAVAARAQRRLARARELNARFPAGAPHFSREHDQTAQRIATALQNWDRRPKLHAPEGPTVQELEHRITGSRQRLDAARAVLTEQKAEATSERVARAQQLDELFPDGAPHYSSNLDRLAEQVVTALEQWRVRPEPRVSTGSTAHELERELEEINRRLTESTPRSGRVRVLWMRICAAAILVVGGTAATLLGVSGGVSLAFLVGFSSLAACAGLLGFARRLGAVAIAQNERRATNEEQRRRIAVQLTHRRSEDEHYQRDAGRIKEAANAVRVAAVAVGANGDNIEAQLQALCRWQEQRRRTLEEHDRRTGKWDGLQQLLAGQTLDEIACEVKQLRKQAGMFATKAGPLMLAVARESGPMTAEAISELERHSEAECAEWQTAIGQRDEEDRHYEERQQEHLRVKDEVRAAAVAIGANSEDVEVQVNALRDWQKQRETELDEHGRRIAEWDELQQILGARTLNEVADDVEQLREDARTRLAAIDDSALAADRAEPLSDDRLSTLETRSDAARGVADTARGELIQFTANLPSAADAEDELEAAKQEHNRVKRLDSTLATTIKFLECAEERVNRNLAPVLRSTVTEWLSRVTGGRYVDCRVDPESLAVDVSGGDGRWRAAKSLSHGTAEQVYLLLRVALAKHLAKPGESCPLIFDDATAASDNERKRVLLETLLAISSSVQVILFTHEDEVWAWAKQRLRTSPNLLIELDRAGVPA